jgi:hypothetical protein
MFQLRRTRWGSIVRGAVQKQYFFFLRNCNYNYNELCLCPLQSWDFFYEVTFIINTLFPTSRETLYAGRLKPFAEASELFTHAVFQLIVFRKKAFPGVHPLGGQKDGNVRVLNRDCREDEWKQSTPLLQWPPLCADWCAVRRCHSEGGLDSSSCLAEPFEFVF